MRRIELEGEDFKSQITEKMDAIKHSEDLGVEIKALLEHLSRVKQS